MTFFILCTGDWTRTSTLLRAPGPKPGRNILSAGDWTRTSTLLRAPDPKSGVSTNFTTPALNTFLLPICLLADKFHHLSIAFEIKITLELTLELIQELTCPPGKLCYASHKLGRVFRSSMLRQASVNRTTSRSAR